MTAKFAKNNAKEQENKVKSLKAAIKAMEEEITALQLAGPANPEYTPILAPRKLQRYEEIRELTESYRGDELIELIQSLAVEHSCAIGDLCFYPTMEDDKSVLTVERYYESMETQSELDAHNKYCEQTLRDTCERNHWSRLRKMGENLSLLKREEAILDKYLLPSSGNHHA